MSLKDNIPSYDGLYDKVREFISEHQGEKGYIDTQNEDCDTIYAYVYEESSDLYEERKVYGVKVEDGEIYALCDVNPSSYTITYSDKDFKDSEDWYNIRFSFVKYRDLLFSIAEVLEEYV